jgi:hypothetical protein
MSNSTDGQIDQLVKAKWLEIGLSPADLAEALGAEHEPTKKCAGGSGRVNIDRLMQVAEALGVCTDLFNGNVRKTPRENRGVSAPVSASLQSLLELRLLRVFRELRDLDAKRMLIQLAEQIVKRQAARPGDAG